ncbi:TPA: class I SAM-dependent methyltransferase [Candidatus Woesearchaeota archaeon]|nr:Methyltransferase type 11 [archaeon GW2011_AR15]MBS3103724.1 class I SAM-dependent methyltransferase [Candidatus Woesearchaeota archaeon]HIH41015.1 class I SAM-dependent methyltransferase [Candidatus Woesearchaeota archaeon]
MKLNKLEFAVVSNPFADFLQGKTKARQFRLSLPKDAVALDIGCSNGSESKALLEYFSLKKLYAVDLDEKMIAIARKKIKNPAIVFEKGDATRLKYPANSFDVVFSFGVINHITEWKKCIKELGRVLKPGGYLVAEELSRETFRTPIGRIMKMLFDRPYDTMFGRDEFIGFLKQKRFRIIGYKKHYPMWTLKYFTVIAEN